MTPPDANLPCRRCNQVPSDAVVIWGADRTGALTPRAAQCRGRCNRDAPPRRDKPTLAVTMTATRPGRCAGCERAVLPGDVIARVADQSYHYECSPPEAPRSRTWQQDRSGTRRA